MKNIPVWKHFFRTLLRATAFTVALACLLSDWWWCRLFFPALLLTIFVWKVTSSLRASRTRNSLIIKTKSKTLCLLSWFWTIYLGSEVLIFNFFCVFKALTHEIDHIHLHRDVCRDGRGRRRELVGRRKLVERVGWHCRRLGLLGTTP